MKNYLIILLLFFGTTLSSFGQNRFIGNWRSADEKVLLQVYETDSEYYGRLLTNENQVVDGTLVLIQMKKRSEKQLFGGTYYDIISRSENEATMKLIDENTIRMKIISGFFSRTMIWHRVQLVCEEKTNQLIVLQY